MYSINHWKISLKFDIGDFSIDSLREIPNFNSVDPYEAWFT
jgi:hypothetical protein